MRGWVVDAEYLNLLLTPSVGRDSVRGGGQNGPYSIHQLVTVPRTWPSADSSLHQSPRGADADVPGGKTGPLFARYPATGHLPRDHFAYLIHRSSGHQIVAATATLLQQVADSTVTVLYRVASQPMSLTSKQAPPFFLASAFFFRVPFFRPLRRVRSAQ